MENINLPDIDYNKFIDIAMRGIVKNILTEVSQNDKKNIHFVVSFSTVSKGVKIPKYLLSQYPKEMTIILQYQFEDLKVDDSSFSIVLSFKGKKEKLVIPFSSLLSFSDPGVNFCLKFSYISDSLLPKQNYGFEEIENLNIFKDSKIKPAEKNKEDTQKAKTKSESKGESKNNNVINIDAFRNNKKH